MSNYSGKKENGVLTIKKSYEKLSEENEKLAKEYDQITKQELIDAVKLLANELGIDIKFTYNQVKNDIK